jgi:serine phosphatase RsbU (regulator of sigma subunit)
MGRGLGAAALMGRLRSALRAYAFAADDAAAALEALDRLTYGVGDVEFATVVLAMLSADRNQMHICRAGHPPPLLVPADGPARLLDVPCGLPLGAPPRARHCYAVDVEHGARLVLYTDGLVERRTETLTSQLAALQAAADAAPDGCEALAEHLLAAMEDGGQHDDVALLAVCIPAD